jgi:Recombination endonuclease VII
MSYCTQCNTSITKGKRCLDCKSGSHGLSFKEMVVIAELQGWKCPVQGTPFELDEENMKIFDCDPKSKKRQRVCVDHCHDTNIIRGLLSDMGNMLVGGFERQRYGTCSIPTTIENYFNKKYAQSIIGERQFI